jgi:hypothetical protein
MIESAEIDGRPAQLIYLDVKFEPVDDAKTASVVKAIFTDDKGGTMFLAPTK